jgi:hypothetical protein
MRPEETWLTRRSAAIYLTRIGCPIAKRTLDKMAVKNNSGKGPPFTRVRWKTVRYRQSDLDAWAQTQMEFVE